MSDIIDSCLSIGNYDVRHLHVTCNLVVPIFLNTTVSFFSISGDREERTQRGCGCCVQMRRKIPGGFEVLLLSLILISSCLFFEYTLTFNILIPGRQTLAKCSSSSHLRLWSTVRYRNQHLRNEAKTDDSCSTILTFVYITSTHVS